MPDKEVAKASVTQVVVQESKPKEQEPIKASKKAVDPDREITYDDIYNAIVKIQRQARVYLNCRMFRTSLYKLVLLKNIIETKVHKEKMMMLYAFE